MTKKLGFFSAFYLRQSEKKESTFCLLLKSNVDIPLRPGEILDVPISFAPEHMQLQQAICSITTRPTNGDGSAMSMLKWSYDIKGIPQSIPVKDSKAPILECRARERLEERVELSFTGINPSITKAAYGSLLRSLSPIHLLG